MKVLIACECSGVIRDAFLELGFDAISCDLKPSRAPGPHYQGDVRKILHKRWDLLIAHPVCRYLANSGAKHLYNRDAQGDWSIENGRNEKRWRKMQKAVEFFCLFDHAKHIPMRAVENPIMHGHAIKLIGREPDQYIQPWMFGDPFSKMTGLWLSGLPRLRHQFGKSYYPEIEQQVWLMPPGPDREEMRSNTYPGIARAMAMQWGSFAAFRKGEMRNLKIRKSGLLY